MGKTALFFFWREERGERERGRRKERDRREERGERKVKEKERGLKMEVLPWTNETINKAKSNR